MFEGLRTAIYSVTELDKAKAWYSTMLEQEPYFDEPFYVGFSVGGYELGLQPTSAETGGKMTGVVTYWGVPDVEIAYRRLLDMGATIHEAPQDVGGSIIVASVFDPFGNILGVIQNPHFSLQAE